MRVVVIEQRLEFILSIHGLIPAVRNVFLAGDFMITTICTQCKKQEKIEELEARKLVDFDKLDELSLIGLKSGFLRITCKRCLKSQGK